MAERIIKFLHGGGAKVPLVIATESSTLEVWVITNKDNDVVNVTDNLGTTLFDRYSTNVDVMSHIAKLAARGLGVPVSLTIGGEVTTALNCRHETVSCRTLKPTDLTNTDTFALTHFFCDLCQTRLYFCSNCTLFSDHIIFHSLTEGEAEDSQALRHLAVPEGRKIQ